MSKRSYLFIIFVLLLLIIAIILIYLFSFGVKKPIPIKSPKYNNPGPNIQSDSMLKPKYTFSDSFNDNTVVEETNKIDAESTNPNWWLNSGGLFYLKNGTASTIIGDLGRTNSWYKDYLDSNPEDTDKGLHPQNIFRLVLKSKWHNFIQQSYFRILSDNNSASSNRNASNGLLLFNRYQDGNNLYYTGLRVDGQAVIKKKYKGQYYTMATKKVIPGEYNGKSLLTQNRWIGIKSIVSTQTNGNVMLALYIDYTGNGNWDRVVILTDDGKQYENSPAINDTGHAGIRTDFMDVEIKDYKISEI